jgi:hypothetical protein
MPILTLAPWELETGWAACRVFATMVHPENERWRQELLAIFGVQCLADLEDAGETAAVEFYTQHIFNPTVGVRVLRHAPPQEGVFARVAKAGYGGGVAGDILLFMIQMQMAGYLPSVEKAVFLMKTRLAEGQTPAGKTLPASRKEILKAWVGYKSVAHFWAAFNLEFTIKFDGLYTPGGLESQETPHERPHICLLSTELPVFLNFLTVLECLGLWGSVQSPSHQRTPTPWLDPTTTWYCEVPGIWPDLLPRSDPLPSAVFEAWLNDPNVEQSPFSCPEISIPPLTAAAKDLLGLDHRVGHFRPLKIMP